MIEIICRENEQEEQEIKLPKNIRQVGNPRGRHKIYMEDYVYTYLQNQAKSKQKTAAVLMGNSYTNKDMRYTFVQGAIECGQAMFQFDSIYLDESFWKYIYMESQEYFKGINIVGWFVGEKGEAMHLSPNIESAHRKYFAGRDKVLMLMDAQEDEEVFYVYEQGYLQKREGYYIYYEKNIPMQEYMIRKRESAPIIEPDSSEEEELWRSPESDRKEEKQQFTEWEELHREIAQEPEKKEEIHEKMFVKSSMEETVSDAEKALQNYRHVMLEKRGRKIERKNKRFLYTAASFFAVAFVVLGAVTISNYQKVEKVENILSVMKTGEEKSNVVVESIPSDVAPLENEKTEDQQQPDQTAVAGQTQPEQTEVEQEQLGQQQSNQTATEQQQSAPIAIGQQQSDQTATEQQQSDQTATEQQQSAPIATGQQQSDQTTAGQQQAQPQPQYYVVQAGDTLESICLKLYQDKSKVAALCQANGITNGNQIQAGQKLLLP